MSLPITAITAAICGLLLLFLAIDTVRQRIRARVNFGDGGDSRLTSAVRAHGNLAEHAPIVILLIAVLEFAHAHHLILTGLAGLFLIARVLHIWGLYTPSPTGKPPLGRQLGVIGTWVALGALSIWTLWTVFTLNF